MLCAGGFLARPPSANQDQFRAWLVIGFTSEAALSGMANASGEVCRSIVSLHPLGMRLRPDDFEVIEINVSGGKKIGFR